MRPLRTFAAAAVATGVLAGPVLACGGGWMGVNLVVKPGTKAALRRAYLAAHPGAVVGDPVPGRTYYGSYSGTSYAVATFGALPTIFRTNARGDWQVRRDTRSTVCSTVVPVELLKAWSLRPLSRSCYALPS